METLHYSSETGIVDAETGKISSAEPHQVYPDKTKGYVYIIHLAKPLAGSRSQHYVGFSKYPDKRLHHHRSNSGSAFLAEANRQGIAYTMCVVFPGTKSIERKLKNTHSTRDYCPCCNPGHVRKYAHHLLPHELDDYKFIDC